MIAPHRAATPRLRMPRFPRRGLYAITPETLRGDALAAAVRAALEGGASVVQYREKSRDEGRRSADAEAVLRICDEHRAPLIVNDDTALARRIGAAGAHVGRDDISLPLARRALGEEAIIGVSCYDDLDRALCAYRAGADYVAFGSFFPSRTKPGAVRATVELVEAARRTIDVPIVAIGGITASNAPALVRAGVDVIAVIEALFGADDIRVAAAALLRAFEDGR